MCVTFSVEMHSIKSALINLQNNNGKAISVELCSNKYLDLSNLSSINLVFYSVTWHTQQKYINNGDINNVPAISLATSLIALGKNVLLHLPCRYLSRQDIFEILTVAKTIGINNILALQGDFIETECNTKADFSHAIHLVRYIKEHFENTFSVGVAGYPSGHPESSSVSADIQHLKEKISAGADFVITQAIFEIEVFHKFYEKCREIGITVPIIPGIYIINSYEALINMSNLCKINIPNHILDKVKSITDKEELKQFGLCHATNLVRDLFSNAQVTVVHVFSLNTIENVRLLSERIIK